MRYYVVGLPVEDLQYTMFLNTEAKKVSEGELLATIYSQANVRVFASYDQAKEYAHGLREAAHGYANPPKTPASKSKVRPVFTIDLNQEINLGELQSQQFQYREHYVNEQHFSAHREKQIELQFYQVNSNLITRSALIRAEFYQSRLAPVELQPNVNRNQCVIL